MTLKRIFGMFMVLLAALTLVACKGGNDTPEQPGGGDTPSTEVDKALADELKGIASGKKVYLTTVGQSDVEKIENLLFSVDEDANIYDAATGSADSSKAVNVAKANLLTAAEVESGSVVLLVTGSSSKGLGSAGTDVAKEITRAQAFADKAAAGDITLIVFHVGGASRRGTSTDPVLEVACPGANLLLVVETGNEDGYFTNVAGEYNIPLYLYSKTSKIVGALKDILGA